MFVYCKNKKCNYSTNDFNSIEELKEQVEKDGGKLEYDYICPKCSFIDSLRID